MNMLSKLRAFFKRKDSLVKGKGLSEEDFRIRVADAKYELAIIEHELELIRFQILAEKNKIELREKKSSEDLI